jgi:hypothetical protein
MHIGIEVEGSRHLGERLLFVKMEEFENLTKLLGLLDEYECSGFYFGAELTMIKEESIPEIIELMEIQPALSYTIEIPISNRGAWLKKFNEQANDDLIDKLHVIHRIDNMDAMAAASQHIRDSHDVKIFYEWSGDVITFRWDTATVIHYPTDYKGDWEVKK